MKPIPNKYDPVHVLLLVAGPLFAAIAIKWPATFPAVLAALVLAKYIAIYTQKPGAAKVIAELEQDAKTAEPPANVTNIVEVPKS